MKVLVIVQSYPRDERSHSGIFNQRSAMALAEICERVEVLAPRPYAPAPIAWLHPRWKTYSRMASFQRDRVAVHRPAYFRIPRAAATFWTDRAAYLASKRLVAERHAKVGFDAILSFDLRGAGALAWRLAGLLNLPAAGWATGDDVRAAKQSAEGRLVARALDRLDRVFYQSRELRDEAARLAGADRGGWIDSHHLVLPRGIATPRSRPAPESRRRIRAEWRVGDGDRVVLSLGRVSREKGVFEMLDAARIALDRDPRLRFLLIGANPGFDDSDAVARLLGAETRIRMLPACQPSDVWELLSAADVFAFTSHKEGMPNSLLEAMAIGLPAVAFGIPAVREIDEGSGALEVVEPFDGEAFAAALLRVAASESRRARMSAAARTIVEERFRIEANMARAIRVMSDLIERGGPRHSAGAPTDSDGRSVTSSSGGA